MTTEALNPEDIRAGDCITVHRWLSHKDNSWIGDVLVVKAVELPYLWAEIKRGEYHSWKHQFDTRATEFATVSDFFIENNTWMRTKE